MEILGKEINTLTHITVPSSGIYFPILISVFLSCLARSRTSINIGCLEWVNDCHFKLLFKKKKKTGISIYFIDNNRGSPVCRSFAGGRGYKMKK